jgi:hypothetical protein
LLSNEPLLSNEQVIHARVFTNVIPRARFIRCEHFAKVATQQNGKREWLAKATSQQCGVDAKA